MRTVIEAHELLPKGLQLESLGIETGRVSISMSSGSRKCVCPSCGHDSSRVHSRYSRTVSLTQPPQHTLHSLYMDGALEEKVNAICERAFGRPLVLNRHAGSMVYLHVGEAPQAPSGVGAPPREYLEALSRLPRLDEQGDGMKSFMGLLLNIAANAHRSSWWTSPRRSCTRLRRGSSAGCSATRRAEPLRSSSRPTTPTSSGGCSTPRRAI